jgi:heat shock protein HtpX
MTLREQIRRNYLMTTVLLGVFTLIVGGVCAALYALYGQGAAIAVAIGGVAWALFSWFASTGVVSAVTGAQPVTKADQPELYRIVENLSIAAGLPATPEVRIVDDPAPNAFAAGRNAKSCYVCVTTGLLQTMDHREIEGVIGHELAHVQHRDVRLMTLVAVLVGVIAMISDIALRMLFFTGARRRGSSPADLVLLAIGICGLILAPLAAVGIQMAISRRREYLADEGSAEITGDPEGLALALRKLLADPREIRDTSRSTAHLYIEGPLRKASGPRALLGGMFDTHPPLEDRIKALEKLGGFTLPPE